MNDEQLRRLQMQQEANSAQIARMNMQLQAQQARRGATDDDEDDELPPAAQGHQPPPQQFQQPPQQYQNVDPNTLVLQAIANQAAQQATRQIQQNLTATADVESRVKGRMQRLVADYPALQDETSELVVESRKVYARIAHENPTLDEATKYELAVREAASVLGARPINAPIEAYAAQDYVMPAGRNLSVPNRPTKSRLTPKILTSAKLLAPEANWDPNTVEGKKNLAELSEYSARFNADADDSQYKYR